MVAQRVVPVGLERVGDEPVVRVDGEVSAARELGVLAGTLDVGASELVGLVGAGFELGLDGECDLERERGDGLEQQLRDRLIDAVAGDREAAAAASLDRFADALIVGKIDAAAVVIADGHPFAAASADDHSLQQRRTFARRSAGAVGPVRVGVVGECQLVGLELVEGDVSRVSVGDQRDPLLARELVQRDLPVRGAALLAPAIDERAGIPGVVQGAQHSPVTQRHPRQLALALAGAHPGGEQQLVAANACTTARAEPVRANVSNR